MGGFFFISFRRSGLYFLDKSRGLFIKEVSLHFGCHHAISTWMYLFQFKKHL